MRYTGKINTKCCFRVLVGLILALFSRLAAAQQIDITQDATDGVYAAGAPIVWHVQVAGDGADKIKEAKYTILRCGLTQVGQGTLDLSTGKADITGSLNEPGTLLVHVNAQNGDKAIKASAGAAVEPEKVQPSAPRPDDFDAFWAQQIDQLHAIPAQPDLEPKDVPNEGPNVEYFKVQMNGLAGSQIYAQLAKPKKEGKYPVLLIVQWAGVYGLPSSRVADRAKQGWIAMNLMPHAIPFDLPDDYYKEMLSTTLKDYFTIG